MTSHIAKIRLMETLVQDRWDCEGHLKRCSYSEGWAWVPFGIIINANERRSFWAGDPKNLGRILNDASEAL